MAQVRREPELVPLGVHVSLAIVLDCLTRDFSGRVVAKLFVCKILKQGCNPFWVLKAGWQRAGGAVGSEPTALFLGQGCNADGRSLAGWNIIRWEYAGAGSETGAINAIVSTSYRRLRKLLAVARTGAGMAGIIKLSNGQITNYSLANDWLLMFAGLKLPGVEKSPKHWFYNIRLGAISFM